MTLDGGAMPVRSPLLTTLLAAAIALAASPAPAHDWPQFDFDARKSGFNDQERKISRYTANQLVRKWQATLPGNPDGSPIVLENVPTAAGVTTIVFVNTRAGHLLAYDARNGSLLWSKQHGGVNDMVTSPAIDPNRQYVYTYGLGGYVHKHQVSDGTEVTTGGWPQLATLKPSVEKHGGALAIATVGGTSYLYVVHGGYPGDAGDYQGHVTTIDLSTGQQTVFNAACSDITTHIGSGQCGNVRNAVWARPGVAFHAPTNRVLFATGNGGTFNGTNHWSESVLAITPNGAGAGGKPIDSYTPTNWLALDNADADLGSTAPVILDVPPGSTVPYVAMQGGKDGLLRLLNIANLSGQGAPGNTGGEWGTIGVPQSGAVLTQPAAWLNPQDGASWTFVANGAGMSGLKVQLDGTSKPTLVKQWQHGIATASPVVANGVIFATGSQVRAFDAINGQALLSTTFPAGAHFHSPSVANGELYVTDSANRLTAYFLPGPKRDFEADNTDDVVWRHPASGAYGYWSMKLAGPQWVPLGAAGPAWTIAGVGDFNGDGRADLLWRDASGGVGIATVNAGATTFATVGPTSTAWQVAGVGDFDGNGKSDVLWRETATGNVGIWFMNGAVATWQAVGPTSLAWQVQAIADLDGDGKSDVLWRETATGNLGYWKMNGAAFAWVPLGAPSTGWTVAGTGDFDGNGWSDILWREAATGYVGIWLMGAAGPLWQAVGPVSPGWQVQRIADFDGNGRADVLWRETGTGNVGYWSMNGATPTWRALGVVSTAWQVQ